MDRRVHPSVGIVRLKDLGQCWSVARHVGGPCSSVYRCKYPEKASCKAVQWQRDEDRRLAIQQIDEAEQRYLERMRILGGNP